MLSDIVERIRKILSQNKFISINEAELMIQDEEARKKRKQNKEVSTKKNTDNKPH